MNTPPEPGPRGPLPVPATDGAAAPVADALSPWTELRRHTPARIALGRTGASLPTREVLAFAAAHARARDAVHVPLDAAALAAALRSEGWEVLQVASRAPTRDAYLRRPDWGRRLDDASAAALDARRASGQQAGDAPPDVTIVLADGLCARAAQAHGVALFGGLQAALGGRLRFGPVVVATQARVALGDEIGERLGSRSLLILLGERPGLSSPDSLGAYLTHAPRIGRSDAQRNCVSNIRPEGLPPDRAARRLAWLVDAALGRGVSGILLKDDSDRPLLADAGT